MSFLDQLLNPLEIAQGSEAWEQVRAGRFTSSEIWKIMEWGKRDMTAEELAIRPKSGAGSRTTQVADPSVMGKQGITYIHQKVAEVMTGLPKQGAYAYPLVYGKEIEPMAADYFAKAIGVELEEVGFQCFGDHAGGSPDRLFERDGIKMGLEIKCPFQSENQIQYLKLQGPADFKELYPEYWWQISSLMLFLDIKVWHFMTFDPRFKDDKHIMKHLVITQDDVAEDQNKIITALESAIKIKLELLNLLR
jgi:hypothetical protein